MVLIRVNNVFLPNILRLICKPIVNWESRTKLIVNTLFLRPLYTYQPLVSELWGRQWLILVFIFDLCNVGDACWCHEDAFLWSTVLVIVQVFVEHFFDSVQVALPFTKLISVFHIKTVVNVSPFSYTSRKFFH